MIAPSRLVQFRDRARSWEVLKTLRVTGRILPSVRMRYGAAPLLHQHRETARLFLPGEGDLPTDFSTARRVHDLTAYTITASFSYPTAYWLRCCAKRFQSIVGRACQNVPLGKRLYSTM